MWKRSAHLTKGLELLKTLPDTPERISQELALQLAFYDALIAIKGLWPRRWKKPFFGPRNCASSWARLPSSSRCYGDCVLVYANRGEQHAALELAEQMMRLAQSVQDPYLLSVAHWLLGPHWASLES